MVFGNLDILAAFLSAYFLLTIKPENITIDDTFVKPTEVDGKLIISDLRFKITFGPLTFGFFDLEMQATANEYSWHRFQFYTCKIHVNQIKSGKDYHLLRKSFSLVLLGENLIDDEFCCHKFVYYDKRHHLDYKNSNEVHFIEILKKDNFFNDLFEDEKVSYLPLYNWMNFFSCKTKEDYIQAAKTDPMINKAWEIIWRLSMDPAERRIAEAYDRVIGDERASFQAGVNQGYGQGYGQGYDQGAEAKDRKFVQNMMKKNLDMPIMMELSGLTEAQIRAYSV